MIQRVDLLADLPVRRREWLPLRQLMSIWAAAVVLLAAHSAWQGWQIWSLDVDRAAYQAQWQARVAANQDLREQLRTEPQAALVAEVDALRRRVQDTRLLLDVLGGYDQSDRGGFSRHLADLASRHVSGVAYTQVTLSDGGSHVRLRGEAESAAAVPRLLQRLAEADQFRGLQFDALLLEAKAPGRLTFDVAGPGEPGAERRRRG